MKSEHICAEARRLQRKYGTNDPFELLDCMGTTVKISNDYAPNGLKGFCAILNRISYVVINGKLPGEEQRVVAAHEAGHLILHRRDLMVGAFRDQDVYYVTEMKEREANLMGAELMLRDEDVLEQMRACDARVGFKKQGCADSSGSGCNSRRFPAGLLEVSQGKSTQKCSLRR